MKPRFLASSLAFASLLACAPGLATDPDYRQSAARLEQVRAQIEQLQRQMRQERARHDKASAQLRQLDEAVAAAAGRLREVEQRLAETGRRISSLQDEVAAQNAHMAAQREQLGHQLRASYANSGGGYLKLLLNADDPLRMGRMLTYHRYLHAARKQELEAAATQLQALARVEEALAKENAELELLRRQESDKQQEIAAARQQRATALALIDARITAQGSELDRLKKDAADLEQLMQRLHDVLADVKDVQLDKQPFRNSRGQLRWPLDGTVLARFGQDRGLGEMRWNGVLIKGQVGVPVQAVARGHVVFADWLRGFGLLMIIDHGDGFMTLYGHNEAIFKENGDWVQAGDIIASVGTGGRPRTAGLYFEVRSGGKPVDPLRWLQPASGAAR